MSNPNDYTVGWICAILTEYVAAQAFLDERHDGAHNLSVNDNNDYTLGRIGKHNVVIAVMPDGEYGTSSAASVARDMLHSFPNIRVGLMVGIAGGAPSQKHDIRLGDIVVSAASNGKGGVFQFDFGKRIQGQAFQETGFLNQPPTLLRAAVNGLKAQYEIDGHQLEETINSILKQKPRLQKKYKRPDRDRLYKSTIVHPLGGEAGCAAVCGDDPSHLVLRLDRNEDEDNPAIHYGLIASSNQLIKDASLRDTLAAEKEVLCFEMEAAGLMNHFPCLVIRGICDYSDTHKNKEWQGYAAMAAAAYAKDLLRRITPHKIEAEKKLVDIISDVKDTLEVVSKDVHKLARGQCAEEQQVMLNWLTPVDYDAQHNDFFRRRQPGTGQWLLESREYQEWLRADKQTLFCPGMPGAGKTVMTAVVINDLIDRFHNSPGIGIAYIYCNFRQQAEQNLDNLLSSLLKQLSREHAPIPQIVTELYTRHKKSRTRPSVSEISTALRSVALMYSGVFLIVDALDECQTSEGCRTAFLSAIFNFQEKCNVKIFATSRFIPEITGWFQKSVSLEIRACDEDIGRYVDGHIGQLSQCVTKNADLQVEVKTAIVHAANGMFLLARLHLDSLRGKRSPKVIRSSLEKLPTGSEAYDKAYDEAMARIEEQLDDDATLAKKVLSWIVCARRPLKTDELEHALAVEVGETHLDEENICPVEDMVSVCVGLVTVDAESGIIRLVHYTTQIYFERTHSRWFPNAESDMAKICITYLSFDVFKKCCETYGQLASRLRFNKLYHYAACNWGHHARVVPSAPLQNIMEFLRCDAKVRASTQVFIPNEADAWRRFGDEMASSQMTGQHVAAYFGVREAVMSFQEEGILDVKDSYGRTPLSWAAETGHDEVVKLLLATDCIDINSKSTDSFYSGQTALSFAAENGHEAVVKLLLAVDGIDINSKSTYGQTALYLAARNGHEAVVELLLRMDGIDITSKSTYGQTALSLAAGNGHEAVVKLLLAMDGIDTKSKSTDGFNSIQTALSLAVQNGHEAVVKLLLAMDGIDINSKSTDRFNGNRTALSLAAKNGHEAVVKLLLAMDGIDLNSKSTDHFNGNQTALSIAAKDGHEAAVKLPLAIDGIDVNFQSTDSWMALSLAARSGYEAVAKLLIAMDGIGMNSKSTDDQTALSHAAENGHEAVVELLLTMDGIDINFQSTDGRTALSFAAENGHEAVVELLLTVDGIDINSKSTHGQTALSFAAGNGHDAVVELLLTMDGIDINSKLADSYNGDLTALSLAAKNGHQAVVKLLLAMDGIDINSKSTCGFYGGRTALSLAADNGHKAVVKLLLSMDGIDINSKSTYGQTALSFAARNGHEIVVKLLLGMDGINVDPSDNRYIIASLALQQ